MCRVLGVPAARFLAALVEKNVSTAATLLGLDSDALAAALGLTLGRAHQLARALEQVNVYPFDQPIADLGF